LIDKAGFVMTEKASNMTRFDAVNELARRRGFFWQSYEIYGGTSGFFTYGHLGTRLKQNIERTLRNLFVDKMGILELESPIITPGSVFEASGHVSHFKEPMVECSKCKKKFRADHLLREHAWVTEADAEKMSLKEVSAALEKHGIRCPECGGELAEAKEFLTMFKTTIGPYADAGAIGYGRPEAAQGIFVEFNRLYGAAREKLPFGVLQIGHALRNEISPRQGLLRLREFTIADLEFFFDPEEHSYMLTELENERLNLLLTMTREKGSEETVTMPVGHAVERDIIKSEWQAVFMVLAQGLLVEFGVPKEKQRFIEKFPWERAHYSVQSFDQEVLVDRWGWVEVSGHAYRSSYDLQSHMEGSGTDMRVFKEYEKPVPREKITLKPIMAKMGPVFKSDAAKVVEMLVKADPEEVEASLKKNGRFVIGPHVVLPEQIEISRQITLEHGKHFIPHVVEPSFGSDRLVYVALEYAYGTKEDRTVLSFPRDLSPVQIGVYPLVSKDEIVEKAFSVRRMLADDGFLTEFDEAGSIGRRYARADEIGVQLGVTVDYDSLKDDSVTIRDRDTWRQVRAYISDLTTCLHRYFKRELEFDALGKPV
jgi:glycyl-tRNA synthetase